MKQKRIRNGLLAFAAATIACLLKVSCDSLFQYDEAKSA